MEQKRTLSLCLPGAYCNMHCKYCYADININDRTPREFNKVALIKYILPIKNDISDIQIWGGEPLANIDFLKKSIAFCKEYLNGHTIKLVTNGILLPKYVDYLIKNNIKINISHDGPGQKYRGFDYLKSQEHIDALKKLSDKNLLNSVIVVLHKKNFSIEKIFNYFNSFYQRTGLLLSLDLQLIIPNNKHSLCFTTKKDFSNLEKSLSWAIEDLFKHIDDSKYLSIYHKNLAKDSSKILNSFIEKSLTSQINYCAGEPFYAFTSDGQKIPCHCCSELNSNIQESEISYELVTKKLNKCSSCNVSFLCGSSCIVLGEEKQNIICNESFIYYNIILSKLSDFYGEQNGK